MLNLVLVTNPTWNDSYDGLPFSGVLAAGVWPVLGFEGVCSMAYVPAAAPIPTLWTFEGANSPGVGMLHCNCYKTNRIEQLRSMINLIISYISEINQFI